MSTVGTGAAPRTTVTAAAIVATGCAALTARPALVAVASGPDIVLVGLFVVLSAIGLVLPLPSAAPPVARASRLPVLVTGASIFLIGRIAMTGTPVGSMTVTALALNSLAAVAEEIWFRRVAFAWLAPAGRWVAIVGSAALFAAVHVTTYGIWVLPLDLAAGLVLAWQRDATGSWGIPAITHVVANGLALW